MSTPAAEDTELLKAVSRTFYLSMRVLPQEMRRAVSLGYLLARATDSVADTSVAPAEQRLAALQMMAHCVAGTADADETEALLTRLGGGLARAQQNPAEFRLLRLFGELLGALYALPAAEREPLQRVLGTIIEGQMWDLTAFREHPVVESDEETRRYTYRVAGCVGEFWTELGYAVLGPRFADPAKQAPMVQAAVRYGQGLQLVNILRDAEEDAARGRRYLCSDAAVWHSRAERWLHDGVDYSLRLRTFRLRFASVLPALLGLRTLRLLRRRPGGKISRMSVYAAMLQAAVCCLWHK